MRLQFPFPLRVRLLFLDCWECALCGENGQRSGGLELHHVWGRVSGAAVNAAVLCKRCHAHACHSLPERAACFRWTLGWLQRLRYVFRPDDEAHLKAVQDDLDAMDRLRL